MNAVSARHLRHLVQAVGDAGAGLVDLHETELRSRADELRTRVQRGESLDSVLPDGFALVREMSDRVTGQRHYDVQVMAGAALHEGAIAEMGTGEGKTLAAFLPSFLHSLTGRGVHVVTANDYLAARDAEKTRRVLSRLGVSVGTVVASVPRARRTPEYGSDITYATSTELGFDYLYDNLVKRPGEAVQRELHSALVDEIDSVLVDEARTPLVIAEQSEVDGERYHSLARLTDGWRSGVHHGVEATTKSAWLLDPGIDALREHLGVPSLFQTEHAADLQVITCILRARDTYQRDRDYVVLDGEVQIVDPNTGRVLAGRRLEGGLHEALEALEGVEVRPETVTLASITLQNLFGLYDRLGGMTGTAAAEAQEFRDVYSLSCVTIPPHRPSRRVDRDNVVFRTREHKARHVVEEVARRHRRGQPVLVGTSTVQASEDLSRSLAQAGIEHQVLNAKHLEHEAEVVASAGRLGAVTVATDMAGRGTDVALGGSAEELAGHELRRAGATPQDPDYDERWRATVERLAERSRHERDRVRELGGLFVLGTELHESRRIDDQLRGRSGRQGDPGETMFALSLEDDLVVKHALPRVRHLLESRRRHRGHVWHGVSARGTQDEAGVIVDSALAHLVVEAQADAETEARKQRTEMLTYDELLHEQRAVLYESRRSLLHAEDLGGWVDRLVDEAVRRVARRALRDEHEPHAAADLVASRMSELYPHGLDADEVRRHGRKGRHLDSDRVQDLFAADAAAVLADRRRSRGADELAERVRTTALGLLDRGWGDHLAVLEVVRDGAPLRAIAELDPLVEFRTESQRLFRDLQRAVTAEAARTALAG